MKKILISFVISFFLSQVCNSQNLEAHYKVIRTGEIPIGNGETKSYTLDYEGLIYHSNDKTISFLRPKYLLNYPDGEIKITTPTGESIARLRMDTIQSVTLYNKDTTVTWNIEGNNYSTPKRVLHIRVKAGIPSYKYFAETKTINGLLCKHVFLYYPSSDKPYADIWYYPGYQLPYSFFGISNMPGLLVQGDFYTLNFTFNLVGIKANEPIDEGAFMPEYFEQSEKQDLKSLQKKDRENSKKSNIMGQ